MTQPESRTVEHLSAAEILARVRFEREHRMQWEDVRGGSGEHLAASYLSDAHADLAAAKEHGLGEGAEWRNHEPRVTADWTMTCICGWIGTEDTDDWIEHIKAAERLRR